MPKDKLGRDFALGQKVARGMRQGSSGAFLKICEVTCLEGGKMYLDNSKQAIFYPEALLILEGFWTMDKTEKYDLQDAYRALLEKRLADIANYVNENVGRGCIFNEHSVARLREMVDVYERTLQRFDDAHRSTPEAEEGNEELA